MAPAGLYGKDSARQRSVQILSEGGKTQWYNKDSKDFEIYKYTNNYFISFIKEKDICNQKEFNF